MICCPCLAVSNSRHVSCSIHCPASRRWYSSGGPTSIDGLSKLIFSFSNLQTCLFGITISFLAQVIHHRPVQIASYNFMKHSNACPCRLSFFDHHWDNIVQRCKTLFQPADSLPLWSLVQLYMFLELALEKGLHLGLNHRQVEPVLLSRSTADGLEIAVHWLIQWWSQLSQSMILDSWKTPITSHTNAWSSRNHSQGPDNYGWLQQPDYFLQESEQ